MSEASGIYVIDSPILETWVQLGTAQGRVISVSFPDQPPEEADTGHELLERIEAYLEGEADDFDDVTVALTVPTAQRGVLEAVREIPYGEDASVAQIARMTPDLDASDETDLTTVRQALADNPAPILIPDHRVRDGPSAAPAQVEQTLRSIEGL